MSSLAGFFFTPSAGVQSIAQPSDAIRKSDKYYILSIFATRAFLSPDQQSGIHFLVICVVPTSV